MAHRIIIQKHVRHLFAPSAILLRHWALTTLSLQPHAQLPTAVEITIRIVSRKTITALNTTYRGTPYPTNVLSFPYIPPPIALTPTILGDIAICAAIVNQETNIAERTAHWAHMVIHGILHLLGYDHDNTEQATIMESLEIHILAQLGFGNPYACAEDR